MWAVRRFALAVFATLFLAGFTQTAVAKEPKHPTDVPSPGMGDAPDDPDGDPGGGGGAGKIDCDRTLSDPVDFRTFDLVEHVVDFRVPGRGLDVEFRRSYRSSHGNWDVHSGYYAGIPEIVESDYNNPTQFRLGPLGKGWDHSYNVILQQTGPNSLLAYNGDNRVQNYYKAANAECAVSWSLDDTGAAAGCMRLLSTRYPVASTNDFSSSTEVIVRRQANGLLIPEMRLPGGTTWFFTPLLQRSFSPPREDSDVVPTAALAFLSEIRDKHGNSIRLEYDSQDRLVRLIDTHCRVFTLQYDGTTRQLSSISDFAGRTWIFSRYGIGEANGQPGDLKSVELPLVFEDAANGWVIPPEHVDATGTTRAWRYHYAAQPPPTPSEFPKVYGRDGLTKVFEPGQSTPISETTYGVSSSSFVVQYYVSSQLYGGYQFTYGVSPQPSVIDRMGNGRKFTYGGAFDQLVLRQDLLGRWTPGSGRSATSMRGNPISAQGSYDTMFEHDIRGRLSKVVLPNSRALRYTWDTAQADDPTLWNNVKTLERLGTAGSSVPVSGVEKRLYDSNQGSSCGCATLGEPTARRDRLGHWTTVSYQDFGSGTQFTAGMPFRTKFARQLPAPASGQPNETPPAVGTATSTQEYEYNCAGQLLTHFHDIGEAGAAQRRDTYEYAALPSAECPPFVVPPPIGNPSFVRTCTPGGYLSRRTDDADGLARVTTFEYNKVGDLVKQTDPDGTERTWVHNQLGQVVRQSVFAPASGGAPRLMSQVDSWYDLRGNLVRQDTLNLNEARVLDTVNPVITALHEYDVLNRRTRTCMEATAFDVPQTKRDCAGLDTNDAFVTSEFGYDGNDQLVQVQEGTRAGTQSLQTRFRRVYDERNKLFLEITGVGAEATATRYDYDNNGNLSHVTTGYQFDDSGFNPMANGWDNVNVRLRCTPAFETIPPEDRTVAFLYDAIDRRTKTTGPDGTSFQSFYDNVGNVIREEVSGKWGESNTDSLLSVAKHQYDGERRRIASARVLIESQAGCCTIPGCSSPPPCTEFWTRTFFNPNGTVQRVESDIGVDATGAVRKVATATYNYDTMGRVRFATDPRGNKVEYRYDLAGSAVAVITHEETDSAPGSSVPQPKSYYAYASTYDALGRVVRRSDHLKNVWTFGYDSRGNMVSSVDPNGHRSEWTYDALGRATKFRRPLTSNPAGDAIEVLTNWDHLSRLVSRVDDNGNATSYTYDTLHRPKTAVMADGTSSMVEYDSRGNPFRVTDANGTVVTSTFDVMGRVIRRDTTVPGGSPVSLPTNGNPFEEFYYDGLSRLVRAEDNDSRVERVYDSFSRVLSETTMIDPYLGTWNLPAHGSVPAWRERTVAYNYTQPPRPAAVSPDPESVPLRMALATPAVTVYPGGHNSNQRREVFRWFDVLGRTNLIRGRNQDPAGSYGPETAIAAMAYAGPDRLVVRDYGELFQMPGDPLPPLRKIRTEHAYTQGWAYSAEGPGSPPIEPTTPASISGSRRISIIQHSTTTAQGTSLGRTDLAWDPAQNKTLRAFTTPEVPAECYHPLTWQYGYDRANRLVGVNHGSWKFDRNEVHTLDGVHNRVSMSYGGPAIPYEMSDAADKKDRQMNQYTKTHSERFEYDNNGNLLRKWKECSSDLNGDTAIDTVDLVLMIGALASNHTDLRGDVNLDGLVNTADLTQFLADYGKACAFDRYFYDYRNQMVRAEGWSYWDADSDEETPPEFALSTATAYGYDVLGRRLSKLPVGQSSYQRLVYGGTAAWQLLEVQTAFPNNIPTHTLASIVYGDQGIDDPVSLRVGTPSPSGGPTAFADYFYLLDDQSSVTALVDTLGNVAERYDYQEYGAPMFLDPCMNLAENASGPATRSLVGNPLLFQARVYDDETGLYEFRTRYMHPTMGRFTSRDRIGTWGDAASGGNALSLLASSPATFRDPLGTTTKKCLKQGYQLNIPVKETPSVPFGLGAIQIRGGFQASFDYSREDCAEACRCNPGVSRTSTVTVAGSASARFVLTAGVDLGDGRYDFGALKVSGYAGAQFEGNGSAGLQRQQVASAGCGREMPSQDLTWTVVIGNVSGHLRGGVMISAGLNMFGWGSEMITIGAEVYGNISGGLELNIACPASGNCQISGTKLLPVRGRIGVRACTFGYCADVMIAEFSKDWTGSEVSHAWK